MQVKQREAEMFALQEERRRRLELERRLEEETMHREELVEQEIKLRERQKRQVGFFSIVPIETIVWQKLVYFWNLVKMFAIKIILFFWKCP